MKNRFKIIKALKSHSDIQIKEKYSFSDCDRYSFVFKSSRTSRWELSLLDIYKRGEMRATLSIRPYALDSDYDEDLENYFSYGVSFNYGMEPEKVVKWVLDMLPIAEDSLDEANDKLTKAREVFEETRDSVLYDTVIESILPLK